ncbi:hypothetical protein INT44_008406 [Umbelopsis vinacea]|uniref:Uncharacterized protein n=1 Tax=Umbelopsis vinacea TaxID=44442 RepID=A0A8H7PYP9_9FUNG|nr:hypothetical protein INT44_008406 [Umbelopsis vinacea]KAI9288449.1 hypothetical protein BC943DRAFT_377555 [Umbelopsis sp. AD052]
MSGFLAPTSKNLFKFLSVDSELFPLLGIYGVTFGMAGYMLGQKARHIHPENNVRMASKETYPWHSSDESSDFKYKFHRYGDPNGPLLTAPSAMVEHTVQVHAPKSSIPHQLLA